MQQATSRFESALCFRHWWSDHKALGPCRFAPIFEVRGDSLVSALTATGPYKTACVLGLSLRLVKRHASLKFALEAEVHLVLWIISGA